MWNGFDSGIFRWFEHQTDGVAIGVAKQFDWQASKKLAEMASINFKTKDCLLGLPHLCNIFYVSVIYSKHVGKVEAGEKKKNTSKIRSFQPLRFPVGNPDPEPNSSNLGSSSSLQGIELSTMR